MLVSLVIPFVFGFNDEFFEWTISYLCGSKNINEMLCPKKVLTESAIFRVLQKLLKLTVEISHLIMIRTIC